MDSRRSFPYASKSRSSSNIGYRRVDGGLAVRSLMVTNNDAIAKGTREHTTQGESKNSTRVEPHAKSKE